MTTLDGQVVSAAESGGSYVVVDGMNTINLAADPTSSGVAATVTGIDGQPIQLSEAGGELVIGGRSTTVTLDAGQMTVQDGRTISAADLGSTYAIVDGTSTINLGADDAASSSESTVTGTNGAPIRLIDDNGSLRLPMPAPPLLWVPDRR